MTALAFAGSTLLVVALVAVRGAPPPPRPVRRPDGRGHVAVLRPPPWFEQLAAVGGAMPAARAWSVVCVVGSISLIALAVLVSPVAAMAVALLVAAAPRAVRPLVERRRIDCRDAQLPATLERLASSLRAGAAPTTAFVALADATPPPLGDDLRGPAAEIQHGAAMVAAVDRWASGPGSSPAVQLAAAALGLGVETGGQVARSMDRVAATLRERRELQAEVHALATQARASAAVLALAPLAFTALVSTIEPGTVRFLLTTPIGLLCLAAGLALEVAGAVWMARITASAS